MLKPVLGYSGVSVISYPWCFAGPCDLDRKQPGTGLWTSLSLGFFHMALDRIVDLGNLISTVCMSRRQFRTQTRAFKRLDKGGTPRFGSLLASHALLLGLADTAE